jgi:hypothetical protein
MLKRWLPASLIASAMALALAGGAVLAFDGGSGSHQEDIFERAAAILGIESADLQRAHDQALREAQDEKLTKIVDQLLAQEIIDQSEADSFTSWLSARPESADDALISKLTSTFSGATLIGIPRLEIRKSSFHQNGHLTDRMAEILGLDPEVLADALETGKTELAALNKLAVLHVVIDDMLEDGSIDNVEADELHAWIDDTPQWLLDLDMQSRLFSAGSLFERHFGNDMLKPFPFGDRDRLFGENAPRFRFEYRGPDGTFSFGPDSERFPFEGKGLEGLLERFEGAPFEHLEELESLEDLFEGFRKHHFFGPRLEELIPPTPAVNPDPSATSA